MSTLPVGNNVNPLSWLSVLNEVNGTTNAEAAQQVSDSNRSVTFTATVNGVETTVTMKVPDDLDLPSEVTPEAIDNLRVNCAKVGDPVTGAENLANWTVKADGVQVPGVTVHMREGVLRASVLKGTCILFR